MFKISWLKKIELLLNKGRPLGENVDRTIKTANQDINCGC